jgi:hypothetical protein
MFSEFDVKSSIYAFFVAQRGFLKFKKVKKAIGQKSLFTNRKTWFTYVKCETVQCA